LGLTPRSTCAMPKTLILSTTSRATSGKAASIPPSSMTIMPSRPCGSSKRTLYDGQIYDAPAYPWSSARGHAANAADPVLQDGSPIRAQVSDWAAYLQSPCDMPAVKALRKNMKTGKPCGPLEFVRQLEVLLGRKLERRPRGRPKKNSLK